MASKKSVVTVKSGVKYSGSEDSTMMSSDVAPTSRKKKGKGFVAFQEKWETLEEVSQAMREEGLEQACLIFALDYTMSNHCQGAQTFGGLCLHDLTQKGANPYQQVICICGETLEQFNESDTIPAFGFGDKRTKGDGIFPLKANGECEDFCELLEVYNEVTPDIKMAGPTNFAPVIDKAIEIVKQRKKFHVLVIVADGQVTKEKETIASIVEASHYPLSIIVIGVGDGPWQQMYEFDKLFPEREYDNFRFVEFHKTYGNCRNPQAAVACSILQYVPEQYVDMQEKGIMQRCQ